MKKINKCSHLVIDKQTNSVISTHYKLTPALKSAKTNDNFVYSYDKVTSSYFIMAEFENSKLTRKVSVTTPRFFQTNLEKQAFTEKHGLVGASLFTFVALYLTVLTILTGLNLI
jgi:hypothetical protein